MGVGESLKKFYFKIEDSYYAFCDWVEARGLKIYEHFVNPIENNGIPSFPFFILFLAILAGLVVFALVGLSLPTFGNTVSVDVAVLASGSPVNGAEVTFELDDGTTFTQLSRDGIAHFDNLPRDASATLSIRHASGSFEKQVVLNGEKIVASLDLKGKAFGVFVANTNGEPVPEATITFTDPDSGQLQQVSTDASGKAEISYSDENALYRLRASAEGFTVQTKTCVPSQSGCTIFLSARQGDGGNGGGSNDEVKGNVVVLVKDEQGVPVEDAFVSLYNADGYSDSIAEGLTDDEGSALFQEIAAAGTDVFVNVDGGDEFVTYYGAAVDDIQEIQADRNTEFVVTLRKATPHAADLSFINLTVVDSNNQPIYGAEVRLFLFNSPLRVVDAQETGDDGKASFEVARAPAFYASASAEGFLPKYTVQLRAGDSLKIVLEKALAGNNGDLEVLVKNADGDLVESATVELITPDGFHMGYGPEETGGDGIASFTQVQTELPMRAIAFFGSQKGVSGVFQVPSGELLRVEMALDRSFATVFVRAQDYSQNNVFVSAVVTASYNGQDIASCTTPSNGSFCPIQIFAGRGVVLKASANGFADTTSEEILLAAGAKANKTLLLLPSNLASDLQILGFSLYPMDASGRVVVDSEHAATSLAKGGWYKAVVVASVPQSQKKGVYLRVGNGASVSDEPAFLSRFDLVPVDENTTLDFGTTFNEGETCVSQAVQQSGSEFKWVNNEYSQQVVGVKTLSAILRVRPEAVSGDVVDLHYRAYAVKNGLWARVPEDLELGQNESIPRKGSCFAKTIDVSLPVSQGLQKCSGRGCITLALTAQGSNLSNSRFLSVVFGTQVLVEAGVQVFDPDSVQNPVVRFTSTSVKLLFQNAVVQPVLSNGAGAVSTVTTARAPGNFLPVHVEFSDDAGMIASADATLEFTGTGQLVLTITPTQMQANLPSTDPSFRPLTALLTTAQGQPVEQAALRVVETGDTNAFLGFPSGGDTLVGTGTQDRGKAGVYVFKGLYPRTVGVFHVEADAGPDFENAISQDVQSVSTSFLDIDPSDFVFNTAGACANGVTVRLLKNIPVGVNVSYQVSGAQSQEQCVEVQQPTTSPFVFDRTRTSKDIVIKPIQNANCALVFAGVLAGSGSVSQAQANLFVNCENLRATPTPDPNATCSDGTSVGACSAVNVGARCNSNLQLVGDIACINGPGGNETCTDGTAMGACSSANAGKRCSSTFTLIDDSTCSATGSQCSPNTCSACAENQCVNLQNAGFCEPVYASGASYNNSISATDIGGRRFVPALAFVRPGDVITWRNNGIEDHQIVFENSSVSPSQSQVLHPGDSFSMTLAQAGAYAYRDGLHPEMRGQVSIVPQNAGQQFLTCISSPTSRPLNCSRLSNDIFKAGMAAGDSIKAPDGSRTVKVTSIDEGTKTASFDILGRDGKKIDSAALKKCDTYAKDGVQFRITDFHSIDVSASFVPSAADFIQDACSPMKFDIGKLFASRLGYLAAQQVFNPSQTQAAIASTASNQLVHYPNAPYFAIMENGPGCTGSGTSLSCTKKITALLPVNGMALSVQNAFGFDTRLNVQTTGSGASCFEVKRITGSALSKIGLFVQETLSGLLPIPGNQYGTVAILFKGDNPDCVDYTFTSDHKVHIKPKAGKDKLDLLLTNPTLQKGLEVPLFKITLRIVPGADSSFALASAPRFTYDKSFPTRIESALEPFVVANNLLTPAYVGSQVIAPKGEVQGLGLKLDDDNGYQVAFPPTAASSDTFAPQQERVPDDSGGDLNEPFDIIGNTGGDEAGESIYNSCSGKDFCTAQDQDALTESIKTGVMQEYKPVLETMDSVSFTSPFNAGQGVVQQAGRAAAGDYASSLTNYYLCKQFGQDPLLQLAQQCYSNMGNPQQPSSFLGSLTQGAQYAGCNSELFDMAFGASRGVAGVGGNIMQGAVGQALNNVPPNMPVGEGIVFGFRKLNTYVTVPVKIAGQEGGFKAIVLNLDLRNAAAAFSSGDFFHSGVDGQEIFTLYGTFGFHGLSFFKPGSRKGSTDPGSDKPLQPYDDGYPFLKKASAAAAILTPTTGGQATLDVAKVGTPNLFTFNKYGFNGKVSLDATSLSSISADPTASQYATQIKTELAAFFVDQKSTFDQSYGVTIVAGDKESIEISSASLLSAAQIVKEYNFADATGFVTPDTQAPSFTTGASGDASIGGGSKNIFNLKITFDKNQLSADSATTASPYVQALQKAKAELYAQVFIRVIQNVMPYLNDEGQSGPSGGVGPFACIEWAESSASKIVLAKSSKVNDVNNEGVETSFTLDAPFACLQGDDFSSILGSSSYLDAVRAIR